MSAQPFYLAGRWEQSATPLQVKSPYDGATVAETFLAGAAEFEEAADAAVANAAVMRDLAAYRRADILLGASRYIRQNRDAIARTLAGEAGKPLRDAWIEADRAAMTFHVAADEARRIGGGEVLPMDLAPHGEKRFALAKRFPIGAIAAISPFNFPLNLSAHKLAPAIAAGNTIVLKPATKTPLSALALARALDEAGLPKGALSVLPMGREQGDRLVTDDQFKLLTFTGSSAVGWGMKARAGRKKIILELGGNAGVIVDHSANVDFAVKRIVAGGFTFAGQSCISVQRVFVHDALFDIFAERLVAALESLVIGDPMDPKTELGPMIDEAEVVRIDGWVKEAVAQGARVLTGGRPVSPSIYAPTLLTDVPATAKVCQQEVFAPLVGLYRFTDFSDAVSRLNDTSFGLQAGIFTSDLEQAMTAFDRFEVGGVIVNDVPAYRIDHMPYGGVKDSGLGREGPRYTMEEMTELKLLVINRDLR